MQRSFSSVLKYYESMGIRLSRAVSSQAGLNSASDATDLYSTSSEIDKRNGLPCP